MSRIAAVLMVQLVLAAVGTHASWTRFPSTGVPPEPRYGHTTAYDSASNSIWTFGGVGNSALLNDVGVFRLDTREYEPILIVNADQGPSPRQYTTSVIVASKAYYFGGRTNAALTNDFFALDLVNPTWTRILPSGPVPAPRSRHGMVLYNGDIIVFGGVRNDAEDLFSDVWRYRIATNTWTLLNATAPAIVGVHSMGLVVKDNYLLRIGGHNKNFFMVDINQKMDVWAFDLINQNWTQLLPTGNKPVVRFSMPTVLANNNQAYVLWGWRELAGEDATDCWRLDFSQGIFKSSWHKIVDPSEPHSRDSFVPILANDGLIYFFGGYSDIALLNEQYSLDPLTDKFTLVNAQITTPPAFAYHSLVVIHHWAFVFGGERSDGSFSNAVWALELVNMTADESSDQLLQWNAVTTVGQLPMARAQHTAVARGDIMLIFGGTGANGAVFSDAWSFHSVFQTWQLLLPSTNEAPPGLFGHDAVLFESIMIVSGGFTDLGTVSTTLWCLDTNSLTWSQLQPSVPSGLAVPQLYLHSSQIVNGNTLLLIGGRDQNDNPLADIWAMHLATEQSTSAGAEGALVLSSASVLAPIEQTDGALQEGCDRSSIAAGDRAVVFGGQRWETLFSSDVFTIAPDGRVLQSSAPANGFWPPSLTAHRAAYYQRSMLVHGGRISAAGGQVFNPNVFIFRFNATAPSKAQQGTGQALAMGWSCSPGSFEDSQDQCQLCHQGSFAPDFASQSCALCPPGTFNNVQGSASPEQCLPCGEGKFSTADGSSACQDCPADKFCSLRSVTPLDAPDSIVTTSTQPPPFTDNQQASTNAANAFGWTCLAIILLIGAVMLIQQVLFKDRSERFLRMLESADVLFSDKHAQEFGALHSFQTPFGGVFSIVGILLMLLIVVSLAVDFFVNNTQETRALLPNIVANKPQGNLRAVVTFVRFGGACANANGSCAAGLQVLSEASLFTQSQSIACLDSTNANFAEVAGFAASSTEGGDCAIVWDAFGLQLNAQTTSVTFLASGASAFAGGVHVRVQSFSGIPAQNSSSSTALFPSSGSLFRGAQPSVFQFEVLPTLFEDSTATAWPFGSSSNSSGYHVDLSEEQQQGSQVTQASFAYSNGVSIRVDLLQTTATMSVQLEPRHTLLLFSSSLLGSVVGLLGALAWLLQKLEQRVLRKFAATRPLLTSRRHSSLITWRTSLWQRDGTPGGVELGSTPNKQTLAAKQPPPELEQQSPDNDRV